MKFHSIALAACAAALIAAPATAQSSGDEGVVVSEDDAKADDDATIRCKRLAPPVGSRMGGKRVCKTNAAWRMERDAASAAARESQERGATGNTRTSG